MIFGRQLSPFHPSPFRTSVVHTLRLSSLCIYCWLPLHHLHLPPHHHLNIVISQGEHPFAVVRVVLLSFLRTSWIPFPFLRLPPGLMSNMHGRQTVSEPLGQCYLWNVEEPSAESPASSSHSTPPPTPSPSPCRSLLSNSS